MISKRNIDKGDVPDGGGSTPQPGDRANFQGTVAKITFQNPESQYSVARLELDGTREITVVGQIFPLSEGEEIEVTGFWKIHRRYGLQLQVEEWQKLEPASLEGLERYLGSGLIKGVGLGFAKRLVATFGLETLRVLSEEPQRLQEVEGLGKSRAQRIAEAWEKQKGMREIMVFLQGHGVSSGFALRIYRVFGPQTINRVKENPYGLAREIKGIGFILADRIAGSLGIEANSPLRIEAGVLYTLEKFTESGNCFAPLDLLTKNASSLLKIETAAVERIVEKLGAHGDVVLEEPRESQGTRVYPQALYQAERRIVQFLLQLLSQPSSLSLPQGAKVLEQAETQMDLLLEKEQQEAILQAVRHKVLVITGGPGTGKTTLLTHLLVLFRRFNISFALAAPTGRAAKRMSEMAGEEAKTVHRLLEYNPRDGGFQRNENNPLEADIVIIDEASMLDLPLTDHLLGAVRANSHLILIGDADQLPPVGPGNILRDLIESGAVPVVVLRHIFRQDRESLIVVNAHRILQGEPLLLETERENSDFVFIERESQQEILETVKELIREKVPQWFQTGSSRMVQVLSPMNRGLLGTVHLNRELQSLLNPEGEFIERGERLFRVADKVMQLRNNYDKGVFNGDLGWIERVDREEEKVRVRFDGQVVAYDFDELDELSLAYATSVHKSQGSEYPAVVISLHTTHYPMLHRSVLYTAVTRGKKLVAVVGNRRALWMAIKNLRVEQRFTGLREKLAGI